MRSEHVEMGAQGASHRWMLLFVDRNGGGASPRRPPLQNVSGTVLESATGLASHRPYHP